MQTEEALKLKTIKSPPHDGCFAQLNLINTKKKVFPAPYVLITNEWATDDSVPSCLFGLFFNEQGQLFYRESVSLSVSLIDRQNK